VPSDPAGALQWAIDHVQSAGWLIWVLAAVVGWAIRRQQKSLARTAVARSRMQQPAMAAAPVASVAPPRPYPAAPVPPPPSAAFSAAPARPTVVPPGDPPRSRPGQSGVLRGAFGDPAHARTAVILAEILASPVALR